MLGIWEKLPEYLETDDGSPSLPALVVAELETGEVKLLDFVEKMERWLTSSDEQTRKRATEFLSDILCQLRRDFLSRGENQHFVGFFCARLADHYTMTPSSLAALAALTRMDKLSDDTAQTILFSLQQNVISQQLSVSARRSFYSIFHNLHLSNKTQVSGDGGNTFLFGLISGMDGESDPRNLVYLFSFLPHILHDIPLNNLAEDVFSVLECYFPVDYNPVVDKDNISRSDLAKGLEHCLSSSKELGEYCVPMIIEKLDSSHKLAHLDSLSLLMRGSECWELEVLSKEVKRLWTGIKSCGLFCGDSEVYSVAVRALVAVLRAFSSAPLGKQETQAFTFLLSTISASSFEYLGDARLSRFRPTLMFLIDVASTSTITAHYFIPPVMKQMLALASSAIHNTTKEIVLNNLLPLLRITLENQQILSDSDEAKEALDKSVEMLLSCLNDGDTGCVSAAYDCLATLAGSTHLRPQQREHILAHIKTSLTRQSYKSSRESCSRVVSAFAEKYPDEVQKYLLSTFELPEDGSYVENFLEMLTWTANGEALTSTAINIFLHYILRSPFSLQAILTLRDYSCKCSMSVLRTMGGESNVALSILEQFLDESSSSTSPSQLHPASQLITNIIRVLEPAEQGRIVSLAYELISPQLALHPPSLPALVLLGGFVAGVDRSIRISDIVALCNRLTQLTAMMETAEARCSAMISIALLINKSTNDSELENILDMIWRQLQTASACEDSVNLCCWTCKALLLRGHSGAGRWMDQMIDYVFDEAVGMEAATGIRNLLHQDPYLTVENHANIQLLYQQRVFEKVHVLIDRGTKRCKPALLSIAHILRNSSPSLLIANMEKVRGVLRDCLEIQESEVQENALHIIHELVKGCTSAQAALLAQAFLPACLVIARSSSNMAVRQSALQSIYLYASCLKPEDVIPYKKTVLEELVLCLDDKKRLVRQEAVRARSKWFII